MRSLVLLSLLAIVLTGAMASAGLSASLLHIRIADADGRQASLVFGTAPDATDGFDMNLGEVPVPPPPPPGTFDVRFVDRPGARRVPGDGSYFDIRRQHSRMQVDTFLIRVQSSETCPVRLMWEPVGKTFCDSLVIEVASVNGPERIDMMSTTFVTIPWGDPAVLRIVKYGNREP